MREIKFEYGFSSVNGIVKKVYHLHEIPNIKDKCDVWNVLPIAYVREHTGLKDKNDKEIYEGDVLKNTKHGNIFTIQWGIKNESYAGWAGNSLGKDLISPMYNSPLYNCEIIGNIYENPELL